MKALANLATRPEVAAPIAALHARPLPIRYGPERAGQQREPAGGAWRSRRQCPSRHRIPATSA